MTVALPTEIYQEIFKYACTDDGRTGRSLALVSRYFREASRLFQLQSLALVGERQLHGFAHYLSGLPPNARRVRHLCISLVLETLPRTTKCRLVVDKGTFDFWEHKARKYFGFIPANLAIRLLITRHAASDLEPQKNEYSSPHPASIPSKLDHTRLFHEYPMTTLRQISQQAPSLQSLSFSLDRPMPDLSRDFARATYYDPTQGFPASLIHIHVRHVVGSLVEKNMWLRSAQKEMLKELSGVIEKDQRVAVVGICHLLDYHEARLHWLEKIDYFHD